MPSLPAIVGQHFAFASGRTGVLQQHLLAQSDMDRLLGASSRFEVEKMLTELRLTDMIDQGLSKADEILPALEAWIRKELQEMCPEAKRPVFSILWLQGDAPVLSFLLKQHHELTSALSAEPVSGMTSYPVDQIRAYVSDGERSALPEHLCAFIDEVKSKESPSPQQIDDAVAQFVADMQMRLARTSGSKLIRRYVSHMIDLQNIRTSLRTVKSEELEQSLVRGGEIPFSALQSGKKSIISAADKSSLPYTLSQSIKEVEEDPIALQRTCADVLAQDIADMWNEHLSIDPIFAFAAIGISQLFLIRSILIGKGNNLSPQEIKRILPPFLPATHYVA